MLVGVIMGGNSSEKDISIMTGNEIIKNLDKNKYEVVPIPIKTGYELIDKVKGVDFAFIALHGRFGEDGRIQSILETLDIPYSGCGVLSSALCMNKNITKIILKSEQIPTADWTIISKDNWNNDSTKSVINNMMYPVVVKPNCGGSSIGTKLSLNKDELMDGIINAFEFDDDIIIEDYIQGEEVTCCILNGEMLPVLSIKPKSKYFDFSSKYDDDGAREEIAVLDTETMEKVKKICTKCWNVFKCSVYARIDMIISNGIPYVLEINTLPGMTSNSLFPKSAAARGISFIELIDYIIEYSLNERR